MSVRFHVLASGSSGNACVLRNGRFGVLVDFGLSPRQLAPRMKRCRVAWEHIHAVLLTHTHTDHWSATTLSHLANLGLPVYCHAEHLDGFNRGTRALAALESARLLRHYEPGECVDLPGEIGCVPIALAHDGVQTTGFRFEGNGWAIGYAADLGSWTHALARQFADVDLLALEFNHDVPMQLASRRHPMLIRRVLGDAGHLSNEQAAGLVAKILQLSAPRRLRHLVQLHLSQECNRPELAESAARRVLDRLGVDVPIHTTDQDRAGPSIGLGEGATVAVNRPRERAVVQPLLPFGEW